MTTQCFVNGKVFTGTGADDFVSAFRIRDGVFDWVGDASDVSTEDVFELDGATVLPGLLDVHTHPGFMASLSSSVSLLPPSVSALSGLLDRLRTHENFGRDDDSWIEGFGYDDATFPDGHPTRSDLDQVSTTQVVFVRRSDGHTACVNSRALELAGITRDTQDPAGARFERDEHGEPNGVLTEIAAVDAVERIRPKRSQEDLVEGIVSLNEHFLSLGIVAVNDLYADLIPEPLRLFRLAADRGFVPSVILFVGWRAGLPDLTEAERAGPVRIGGVKLFMDGAYSNRTAWVVEPYPGSDDHGLRTVDDDELRAAVTWARRNNVQVAIHEMGDRAATHVLDMFENEEPWLGELPSIRLEHASLFSQEMMTRLARARMRFGVVTHSIFFFAECTSYARNLTDAQFAVAYPIRTFYERVPLVALASDAPATAWEDADNPFTSIQAAVERRAHDGSDFNQAEAVTVGQALHLYTGRAAQLSALDRVGLIAPGYRADFVVLDRDVFTLGSDEIAGTSVLRTFVDGAQVYSRG